MIIIYGEDPPKISFTQSPKRGVSFKIENDRVIQLEPEPETISWRDIYPRQHELHGKSIDELKNLFADFTRELLELAGSKAEREFFSKYVHSCLSVFLGENPWETPALIPQVWVNWIHYNSKDRKRAERIQKEPFRVDFMIKDTEISESQVIVEIDGLSHFCDNRISPAGKPIPHVSFTQHTRKDRWLRKQGWQVFRITSEEVEQCEDFNSFFHQVFGKWPTGIPF